MNWVTRFCKTLSLVCLGLLSVPALAQEYRLFVDQSWPIQLQIDEVKVQVFEPQFSSTEANISTGRAAFSVKSDNASPVFGAFWFRADSAIEGDKVSLSNMRVEQLKYPETDSERLAYFRQQLNARLQTRHMLVAKPNVEQDEAHMSAQYKHEAPDIYYRTEATVLVSIDGDPKLQPTDIGYYQRVVNTPFFIVLDTRAQRYYLKGGKWWYSADSIFDPWQTVSFVEKDLQQMADASLKGQSGDIDAAVDNLPAAPAIIVTTQPAEIVLSHGEAEFAAVTGTSLLYMSNSEQDVVLDIDSQEYYLLLSGRWYRAGDLHSSNWQHIPSDALPNDFANIPDDSPLASVRSSVAGTAQAREAVLNNSIPQTAEVSRHDVDVDVSYDGDPAFSELNDSGVAYALNTASTVLKIRERFYLVNDGIWYEANTAWGPWQVSTRVPDEVDSLTPDSPVYPVKYVYIYDYTPDVVYVGYTPGYYGSYVWHGTVIYGTGYRYRHWYHHHYYARPVTWGFGVHYHPYAGWGFTVGLTYNWLDYHYGHWGYTGYRFGYRHGYYHHHHHSYYHGYRNGYRHGYSAGRYAGYRASHYAHNHGRAVSSNAYQQSPVTVATTDQRVRAIQRQGQSMKVQERDYQRGPRGTQRQSQLPRVHHQSAQTQRQIAATADRGDRYTDQRGVSYQRTNEGRWQVTDIDPARNDLVQARDMTQRDRQQGQRMQGQQTPRPQNQLLMPSEQGNRQQGSANQGNRQQIQTQHMRQQQRELYQAPTRQPTQAISPAPRSQPRHQPASPKRGNQRRN